MASSSQRLALLPDPQRVGGGPGGRSDPTLATHLGSEWVPGEEGVKPSQHRQKSEDCRFVAGLDCPICHQHKDKPCLRLGCQRRAHHYIRTPLRGDWRWEMAAVRALSFLL